MLSVLLNCADFSVISQFWQRFIVLVIDGELRRNIRLLCECGQREKAEQNGRTTLHDNTSKFYRLRENVVFQPATDKWDNKDITPLDFTVRGPSDG